MNRRHFIQRTGLATSALLLPSWSRAAADLARRDPLPGSLKKRLADAALNAATARGASYVDVRIGRYLNQSVATREDRVQDVTNTESYGAGIRVIANGAWGFMATDQLTAAPIARAAVLAVVCMGCVLVRTHATNIGVRHRSYALSPTRQHAEYWAPPIYALVVVGVVVGAAIVVVEL